MSAVSTSPSRRWELIAIWGAFTAIALLYLFGLAASAVVPFGPPISFASVVRQVSAFGLFNDKAISVFHGGVLGASIAALLVYSFSRSRRYQRILPLVCLLIPLFFTGGGFKGVVLWLLAMPAAPALTIASLAGQDGEFYAEGFLVCAAIGWWMILCCALFIRAQFFFRASARSR
jgi:hypothetical protein